MQYPITPWQIVEDGFSPAALREKESVFALGNGFIGMRGNLEEIAATGAETIQGTFLNGVFDSEPIVYGESAYGYAKNHETICNVMDAKSVTITVDGEPLDLGTCQVEAHRRVLDLQTGTLRRSFRWHTRSGCLLQIETERLVSLTRQHLAATSLRVRCDAGCCTAVFTSQIAPAVISEGDSNDPRNAAGKDRRLAIGEKFAGDHVIAMEQRTKNTGFTICCAVDHRTAVPGVVSSLEQALRWTGEVQLSPGETFTLEKHICYTAFRTPESGTLQDAVAACQASPRFSALKQEQRTVLESFWDRVGMEIDGDDALLQGIRFNLFHLLQSAGRDGKRNIAAKGLTGEGYEGHVFWDTEAYILPVFLYTEPELARKLLEYRYAILPKARERARVMGHPSGALFAWRTIDGEECSAYFPAGTAQYHINGDIAHAVMEYWRVTGDLDFLAECGAEILMETARVYYDLGFFSREKGGFVIHCVTGPDEYNVMVNNNVYTNRVAQENLRSAGLVMELLQRERPEDYRRLCDTCGFTPAETEDWRKAASQMYFPPASDGIYPQDDEFLDRKPWPLDSIPPENHPLLMHYHGLTIYRHMVCKQADLILAMTQYGENYTLEEKRRNFFFYDSVTTHDSSLSMAVFAILACEIRELQVAYDYFMSSARLDLDDMHHNTKDGLHMANMAGTWNGMTRGFGGMRVMEKTIAFSPVCPPQWKGYRFRVGFQGRTIEVRMDREGASYRLIRGKPLTILSYGKPVELQ